MNAPANSNIELNVSRGSGLYLHLNGRLIDDSYGAIVMAELAQLRDFPNVRVDVQLRSRHRPAPATMAQLIATELGRNESGTESRRTTVPRRLDHRCRAGAGHVGPAGFNTGER